MLEIIKEETIGEYVYTHYSNGAVVKQSVNAVNDVKMHEEEPFTDIELLMQANIDAELRDLEIQQNQEILAQQMSSIELAILGGNV